MCVCGMVSCMVNVWYAYVKMQAISSGTMYNPGIIPGHYIALASVTCGACMCGQVGTYVGWWGHE